jgi:hypothetical protein
LSRILSPSKLIKRSNSGLPASAIRNTDVSTVMLTDVQKCYHNCVYGVNKSGKLEIFC